MKFKKFSYIETVVSLVVFLIAFDILLLSYSKINSMKYSSLLKENMLYTARNIVELYKANQIQDIDKYSNGFYIEIEDYNKGYYTELNVIVKKSETSDKKFVVSTLVLNSELTGGSYE